MNNTLHLLNHKLSYISICITSSSYIWVMLLLLAYMSVFYVSVIVMCLTIFYNSIVSQIIDFLQTKLWDDSKWVSIVSVKLLF